MEEIKLLGCNIAFENMMGLIGKSKNIISSLHLDGENIGETQLSEILDTLKSDTVKKVGF